MGKVTADMSISLDGFVTGPNPRPGFPSGEGGEILHDWMFPPSGSPTEQEREMRAEWFNRMGALLMGKKSFTVGEEPWGEDPPFHVPVFVLTHEAREKLPKQGGTTYIFVTDEIKSALAQARATAGDKEVTLHGASIIQQCLQAGLLDELQLHLVPVLLGEGIRLFDHLSASPISLECTRVVSSPTATHLRFRVVK